MTIAKFGLWTALLLILELHPTTLMWDFSGEYFLTISHRSIWRHSESSPHHDGLLWYVILCSQRGSKGLVCHHFVFYSNFERGVHTYRLLSWFIVLRYDFCGWSTQPLFLEIKPLRLSYGSVPLKRWHEEDIAGVLMFLSASHVSLHHLMSHPELEKLICHTNLLFFKGSALARLCRCWIEDSTSQFKERSVYPHIYRRRTGAALNNSWRAYHISKQ